MPDSSAPLKKRIAELTQIVRISLVLNSTLALDDLLRYIMDSASELVGAEAASILLVDDNTRELVFAATSTTSSAHLIGQPVPLEGSIAGTILRENRAIAIDDVSQDSRHYRKTDQVTRFQTRSILGVPMLIRDKPIGVLEAVNKREGVWTEQNRGALMILAAQAAVAIENARLVSALRAANKELSQLDKLKNDFIALASHELRTPLGVILGYATFLREEASGDAAAHADAVYRSAIQLRAIVEQLTNLQYLKRHGEMELMRDWVPVSALLSAAEEELASLVQDGKHRMVVNRPAHDPALYVDTGKIQIALGCLLDNAVKFTPAGGQITLEAIARPDDVWFVVRDTGPGLTAEAIQHIFKEFVQVEDHMTRRHGGLGLGLSIARGLAEAHHGRLWAESAGPDQGSAFFISLPLAPH